MDIQEYISSGIIEAYVLGIANEEEVRELERLAAQYPEINLAIRAYQQDLENFSELHAITPPADLKQKIWEQLSGSKEEHIADADRPMGLSSLAPTPPTTASTLDFNRELSKRNAGSRAGLAAAVLLLLGSAVLNFVFWNKNKANEAELAVIRKEQQGLTDTNENYKSRITQLDSDLQLATNPAVKAVPLAGVGSHTESYATVLWDTRSKEVYLSLNYLPPAPVGKQYQLWAIVDGQPVDLGVFPKDPKNVLQKMKVVPSAQMFAITLEQEGGSKGPTMDQMFVAGKT